MGAATPPEHGPHVLQVGISVGALTRRIDRTDWMRLLDEMFRIVQRHAAGEPPVVGLCGACRAIRPAVLVHR